MNFMMNDIYKKDIQLCVENMMNKNMKESLFGKKVLITGATGMIGSTLTDILMELNRQYDADIHIIAMSRHERDGKERFHAYWQNESFSYMEHDITEPLPEDFASVDYIFHGASNTHPRAYATDPIGTITTNVNGTQNLLDYMVRSNPDMAAKSEVEKNKTHRTRFVFLSSVEIYGENVSDAERFSENDLGYIDCNTMRAGYPESKRLGEALCNAYAYAKGTDFVIPRLSRVYGPTMRPADSKAIAQFIQKAVAGENIILKSEGTQTYSYTYVVDAAMAVLFTAANGVSGEAYNVADRASDIALKDLAGLLADAVGSKVIYQIPDDCEKAGYSKATRAMLNPRKLEELGWHALTHIQDGLEKTVRILTDMKEGK